MSDTEVRRASAHAKGSELWRLYRERDAARAELSRLRGVVEAIQALADEWSVSGKKLAPDDDWGASVEATLRGDFLQEKASALRAALAPVSSSGEAGCPDCGGSGVVQEAHDGGTHPVHCRCTYAAPSSGEAESGEGDCTQCGLPDLLCVGHGGNCCEACRATGGCTHIPAPVPSGGQADGEGEGLTEAEKIVARLDTYTQEQHAAGIAAARGRAARPVLSREAVERVLRWHGVYGFTGEQIACTCDHKVWRDQRQHRLHLAYVLAGGEQA